MRFELRAITSDGRLESLETQAVDEASARRQAESRGYTVLAVRARRELARMWRRGSARFPVPMFSQELLELLNAGLPLVVSIETLALKERNAEFRTVLERIVALLREGLPLSAALEDTPTAFPPLYIATVRAAERTGDLAPALTRYVAYHRQLDVIRKRVVSASIYPLILLGVGMLVTVFLLFYVVPRFGAIYEDRGGDLPLFSRLLLSWGHLVKTNGILLLGVLAAAVTALVAALRAASVRAALGDAVWKLPHFGERLRSYQLARFYRTMGMLLKSGMALVASLDMGAALLHPVLRERLGAARRAISEGHGVSEAMEANGLTTPVAMRMLAVGEQSGSMGEMMERIAAFHDEELSRWVEWFTRIFEPLLMAAIGLVIGTIVILMYMPIFELAGNLQ